MTSKRATKRKPLRFRCYAVEVPKPFVLTVYIVRHRAELATKMVALAGISGRCVTGYFVEDRK